MSIHSFSGCDEISFVEVINYVDLPSHVGLAVALVINDI